MEAWSIGSTLADFGVEGCLSSLNGIPIASDDG